MTYKPTEEILRKAQEAWDAATNAYNRYPGSENWEKFLECKDRVLRLKEQLEKPAISPALSLSTSEKIYTFLQSRKELSSSEICQSLKITKDQLRHGLLKLLDEGKIEKIKTGFYKVK